MVPLHPLLNLACIVLIGMCLAVTRFADAAECKSAILYPILDLGSGASREVALDLAAKALVSAGYTFSDGRYLSEADSCFVALEWTSVTRLKIVPHVKATDTYSASTFSADIQRRLTQAIGQTPEANAISVSEEIVLQD